MHTIEIDDFLYQYLVERAIQEGKTPSQWLKDVVCTSWSQQSHASYQNYLGEPITAERQDFPDLAEFHKTYPMQKISAAEFLRQMRDEDRY